MVINVNIVNMAGFLVRIVLSFTLPLLISAQLKWTKITSVNRGPSPRRDVAIGYDSNNKQILVYGGRGGGIFGDTWAFNLTSREWKELNTSNHIGKRFSVVSGVWSDGFYVATGQLGSKFFNDIWRLDLSTFVWTQLPLGNSKPEERYGAAGGFFQHDKSSLFYLTHGFASKRYSNTFVYDVSKNEGWKEVFKGTNSYNPNYPHARCLHSGTMLSRHKFVMYGGCLGGGGTGGPCPADDGWTYDAEKDEWTRLPHCASPRQYSAMALLPIEKDSNGKDIVRAVLYGGSESSKSVISVTKAPPNEVVIFNPETEEWTKKTVNGSAPPKRAGHAMVTVDNGIIMFGGSSSEGNDIWLLEGTAMMADKTPDGDECNLLYFSYIQLHGIFMFIGWGVLLQLGMFFARYFRYKDPWWFKMHRVLQVSGLTVSLFGFAFAIVSVPFDHFMFAHGGLGLVIMIIGLLQPLNAFFRPHKTDESGQKSLKRIIWEIYHINAGRLALLLALINISLGVFLAVVPYTAWVIWFVMFALWVAVLIVMEIRLQYNRYKTGNENMVEMTNQ